MIISFNGNNIEVMAKDGFDSVNWSCLSYTVIIQCYRKDNFGKSEFALLT